MSGVGSTNAMKKGSANNPFLAYSEADMQGFLNSVYTGCIVKYTGPAINRTLSEQNKTVPDYAQNLVFNRVNYGWPAFYDGNVKFIITEKTNEGTNTWYLAAGKYINGAWDFSRNGAFNGDVVLTNSLEANPTSVCKLWTPKDKWNNDYINDQGNLTFWTYDEDVVFTIAPIDNNDIDYTDLTGITIVPYKVNELYKVVYGSGEYYYEEFCHISDTPTTANSDYIAPGKTAFDFTGNLQTGNGSKINPYIASTADEMAAYLTSSYKGAFVKYIGETVAVGGTPVPVNPIAVGDTISKLYFDTTKEVDFSKFVYDQPFGDDIPTGVAILLSSQQNVNILTANDLSVAGMSGYVLMLMEKTSQTSADVRQTILYASEALPDLGVSQAGWQSGLSLDLLQGNTISIVNAQDVWGAYISKDGQWTSGGGESYVKNAIYQVAEDGDTTMYMILPTLSNPGTAADLAQGKQLIDGEGKVVEGEAVKGLNLIKYANGTLTEFDTDAELTIGESCDITLSGQRLLSYVNIPNAKVISMMAFAECENLTTLNQNICANINAFYSWFYGSTKKIYPDSLVTRLSSVNTNCFISVNNNPYAIYIGGYYYINSVSSYITNNVEVLHPNFVSGSRINTIYTFNKLKCIPTGAFYSVKFRYTGNDSMTINAPELEAIHRSAIYFDTESSSYLPSLLILNASKIKYYGNSAVNIKVAGVQNYNLGEYYGYGHFNLYSTDGSTKLYYNDYPNAKEWYGGNFDRTKMLNLPKATAVSIDGGIGASIPLAKTVSWYNMPTGVELPECEKLDVTNMPSNGVIIGPKVKEFNLYGNGCTEIHLPNFEGDTYLYTDISAWRSSVAHINCNTLEIIDCPKCSKYVNITTGNLKSIKLDDNIYSIQLQGNIASNCSMNLLNSSQSCYITAIYSGGYLDITLSAASHAYIAGSGIGTVTIIDNGAGSIHGGKSINIAFSASMINYSLSNNSWLENISMPTLERITLTSCPKLTDLYMPNAISNYSYFLNVSSCTSLSAIIFTKYISSIYTNYLYRTPIQSSSYLGYFGSIYVPASYVQSYKRAQGWSYYSSRITSITDLPQELKDKYGLNGVE